jgi:type II secretory ATPase GspE/PulE/Tfp pilus assembly ATPase PilB-like protein
MPTDARGIRDRLSERLAGEDAPAAVDAVLSAAVEAGATDIHLSPAAGGAVEVAFRIDGVIHPVGAARDPLAPMLSARLKILADLVTYRADIPQEGRIPPDRAPGGVDCRLSTFPTIRGERVVVRLFDARRALRGLDDLGFDVPVRRTLDRWVDRGEGLLLFTGPATSGKTTTLYALLKAIVARRGSTANVVTLEDPVEYEVAGISQTQIQPAVGLTFAAGLRSILRQDPQVILVGEIRDPETAGIAIQASLTGHLILGTLHAGRAVGVFPRLLEMGIEPYLAVSSVAGVLAQRLVRVRCAACGGADAATGPAGCAACWGTGYRGLSAVGEVLEPGPRLRAEVSAKAPRERLEQAAAQEGMRMLEEAMRDAVRRGVTTEAETRRVLG